MPDNFTIKIEGIEKVEHLLKQFPVEVKKHMRSAAKEATDRFILPTVGLKKYPPATEANRPPVPYYIRGRGTETKSGNRQNSERLGTQWYTRNAGIMGLELGNRASYASYVHGERQAQKMGSKGWRKLTDVAKEKTAEIQQVFAKWIQYTLDRLTK